MGSQSPFGVEPDGGDGGRRGTTGFSPGGGAYVLPSGALANLPYQGGTQAAGDFILIHELAHALGVPGFSSNDADPATQAANNSMVMQHCVGVLSRAEGVYAP